MTPLTVAPLQFAFRESYHYLSRSDDGAGVFLVLRKGARLTVTSATPRGPLLGEDLRVNFVVACHRHPYGFHFGTTVELATYSGGSSDRRCDGGMFAFLRESPSSARCGWSSVSAAEAFLAAGEVAVGRMAPGLYPGTSAYGSTRRARVAAYGTLPRRHGPYLLILVAGAFAHTQEAALVTGPFVVPPSARSTRCGRCARSGAMYSTWYRAGLARRLRGVPDANCRPDRRALSGNGARGEECRFETGPMSDTRSSSSERQERRIDNPIKIRGPQLPAMERFQRCVVTHSPETCHQHRAPLLRLPVMAGLARCSSLDGTGQIPPPRTTDRAHRSLGVVLAFRFQHRNPPGG